VSGRQRETLLTGKRREKEKLRRRGRDDTWQCIIGCFESDVDYT